MNIIILKGRLTRDVEIKTTQSNVIVGKFSIAVNDNYKDNKKTYFFNVTSFGKLAENINKYFKKGSEIIINGKLVQNNWTDKDSIKKHSIEIMANGFDFCGSAKKPETTKADTTPDNKSDSDDVDFDDVDDIKFPESFDE